MTNASSEDNDQGDLRTEVTELIRQDTSNRGCLRGKAAAIEPFLRSQPRLTAQEKNVCAWTSLALLFSAEEAQPQRVRSTGLRKRFSYYVPYVGRVCQSSFAASFGVSITVARYKSQVVRGKLLNDALVQRRKDE